MKKERTYNGKTLEELENLFNEACVLSMEDDPVDEQLAGIKAVAEVVAPGWIKVSDRLPDQGKKVWVYHPEIGSFEAELYLTKKGKFECWQGSDGTYGNTITHWQPLPSEPEVEG